MITDYKKLFEETPIHLRVMSIFERLLPESKIFVETGCHVGNSLLHAIHSGYTNLYSCDIDLSSVSESISRISPHCEKFKIEHTDSISFFKNILPTIDQKVTFWLDAHGPSVPTWGELDLIKTLSPVKNHSIVIDDIPIYFSNSRQKLEDKIKEINPEYEISYEDIRGDGSEYVLVAIIK